MKFFRLFFFRACCEEIKGRLRLGDFVIFFLGVFGYFRFRCCLVLCYRGDFYFFFFLKDVRIGFVWRDE